MRNLITLFDLDPAEIDRIFAITKDLKEKFSDGLREPLLPGRVLALLFEKPSLRTRVSFEASMVHLGGGSLFMSDEVGFGRRESIADFARVISEYVDAVVIRSREHNVVEQMAEHCRCSVINGLTNLAHPCQVLADLYTLKEHQGSLSSHTIAWVGDANNVARSLAVGCSKVGMKFIAAIPEGYHFDAAFLNHVQTEIPTADIRVTKDPAEAVAGAIAVYTDVWASMGQESESEKRKAAFDGYQVNAALMAQTPKNSVFMHCLPARRGLEVTDEVLDGPSSIVLRQAANRLHVQKGILAWLMASKA